MPSVRSTSSGSAPAIDPDRQLADLYQGPPPDADGAAPDPEDSPAD